jgi:hypothetical protein
VSIAEQNYLDDETESLIREVFPTQADDWIDSDSILDIHKLSLSDTFKAVLKHTLKMGLSGERQEVASALGEDMLNIETLLIEKFLGFYNDKPADIKNYLYISWALWAYLMTKQQEVIAANDGNLLPFYGVLPEGLRAVTLNYTAFLQNKVGHENAISFHGSLADYVRMDTRDLLPIENVLECDPSDFIRNIIRPNVDVTHEDLRKQKHVIPALVPPLRLKPILSHQYIKLWAMTSFWVKEAKHIVIVGYSFNNADEHLNDILRNHPDRNIDIIVPEATSDYFLSRMEKVFGTAVDQYSSLTVNGHKALKAKKIRLIAATATEVDITKLFGI